MNSFTDNPFEQSQNSGCLSLAQWAYQEQALGMAYQRTYPRGRGFLLWLLVLGWAFRVTVFVRRRSQGEFASIDTSAAVQILLVFLLCIYLLLSFRHLKPLLRSMAKSSISMLLLYYTFGILSAAWSPSPMYSMYRAVEAIVQILAIFLAMSYFRNLEIAERRMIWVALIVILFQTYANSGLLLSLWAFRSNSYPAMGAMICCYCVGELLAGSGRRRRFLFMMALICLGFVALGTSTASIISTICGFSVAFMLSRNRKTAMFLLIVAVVIIGVVTGGNLPQLLTPLKSEDYDIIAMSGRIRLWTIYWEQITNHLVLGSGFGMISRILGPASNAHNSVIAALGGTGFVGISILLIWVLRLAKEMLISIRANLPSARGTAAGLTAGLVNSCSLAFLGEHFMTTTLVFTCLMAFHMLYVVRKKTNNIQKITEFWF